MAKPKKKPSVESADKVIPADEQLQMDTRLPTDAHNEVVDPSLERVHLRMAEEGYADYHANPQDLVCAQSYLDSLLNECA